MKILKKLLSIVVVCSLVVSLAGVSNASPGQVGVEHSYSVAHEKHIRISKEDYTTYVKYHETPRTVDIRVVDKHTGQTVFNEYDVSIGTVLSWLEQPTERNRQKRFGFVIPLAWGVAEIITTGLTVATGVTLMESRGVPIGKPNRKQQGREMNTKQRSNSKWKSRSNKDSNRPMKKHTPSPKHKGGKK
ncbi:hypothetical protein [Paenibacillus popilliae]|uniref:Uncharacterized protein n=1 Tax=Paenibacillus popilliae ATCC 14706 TaxID=1212764 RepID=M9M2Q5_PAEPP|nr:hypothetical protein [Paenibacillus popilliae]GAC41453.1 hypothetical protein PPOP_0803 [Paenibacillus popilliae ATCC 14706]